MSERLKALAEDFFNFLAKNFPVMCAEDEFYFFPRSKGAIDYLDSLENFNQEKIKQDMRYLKSILNSLEKIDTHLFSLEETIDIELLKRSIERICFEFEKDKLWQKDPSIYLKLSLFGIEQIISSSCRGRPKLEALINRLKALVNLLSQAMVNLKDIPKLYQDISLERLEVILNSYFASYMPDFIKKNFSESIILRQWNQKLIEALGEFRDFLRRQSSRCLFLQEKSLMQERLRYVFGCRRSLNEIYELASVEYEQTLKDLNNISQRIASHSSWQETLANYRLEIKDRLELLKLYESQIEDLRDFLIKKKVMSFNNGEIIVELTPFYLQPFRASASYSSKLSGDLRLAIFYISFQEELHQEYLFLIAHETYPGHHLLDSRRISLSNPIRAQLESPLFYEGWASYGERLIEELGYVKDRRMKMIGLRRQLWRALRAKLDIDLHTKGLSIDEARNKLMYLGYNQQAASSMAKHYCLTPGYQLCYTLGKIELQRLKETFVPRLGMRRFHDIILEGGQLPFEWIEKRLKEV